MRTLLLSALFGGVVCGSFAQGQLVLDNLGNSDTNPLAAANGLFWISTGGAPALIHQDFNAAFYAGTDSANLSLIATFLLSNGSAVGDNQGAQGIFVDPPGTIYTIPGASDSAFVQIQAWTGNFNSYAAALSGGASAAQSPVFKNPVSIPPGFPPDLVGMPGIVLGVPEPSTFWLIGFALLFLIWRPSSRQSS